MGESHSMLRPSAFVLYQSHAIAGQKNQFINMTNTGCSLKDEKKNGLKHL